jgi:hypothetical protein
LFDSARSSSCNVLSLKVRITYTPEELSLFEKLHITEPICSTNIDDCLKLLNEKRDNAQNQLKVCEQQNQLIDSLNDFLDDAQFTDGDSDDTENTNTTLIKTTLDCLDTYLGFDDESMKQVDYDNYNRNTFDKSKSLLFSDTNSEISYLDLNYESDCSSAYKTPTNSRDNELMDSSNAISDDSDVTIADTTSNGTPIMIPLTKQNPVYPSNTPPVIINRQLSDGYSSSGQLSASSNIGGLNPFFSHNNVLND